MGESRAARDRAVPGSLTAHPAKTRDGCAALHIALAGAAAGFSQFIQDIPDILLTMKHSN
jgi:hypothetical protein